MAEATARELYDPYREGQRALLDEVLRQLQRVRLPPATPTQPTLVVWGAGDQVFPLALGQRLATAAQADLRVIPDARHAPNLEHPRQFSRIVIDFLSLDGPLGPSTP